MPVIPRDSAITLDGRGMKRTKMPMVPKMHMEKIKLRRAEFFFVFKRSLPGKILIDYSSVPEKCKVFPKK